MAIRKDGERAKVAAREEEKAYERKTNRARRETEED